MFYLSLILSECRGGFGFSFCFLRIFLSQLYPGPDAPMVWKCSHQLMLHVFFCFPRQFQCVNQCNCFHYRKLFLLGRQPELVGSPTDPTWLDLVSTFFVRNILSFWLPRTEYTVSYVNKLHHNALKDV